MWGPISMLKAALQVAVNRQASGLWAVGVQI